MSGGHWNYSQNKLLDLGERLREERNPILRAMGHHLEAIAKELDAADRFLSYDTSDYDFSKMAALLPDAAFKAAALGMIEEATIKLEGARALIAATHTPSPEKPHD